MIQILYTFIGVLIAFGIISLICYFIDLNDKYKSLKNKIDKHIDYDDMHEHKIPYRNSSYQHAPYFGSESDLRYRVNQLNDRVNYILDELDDLKLKWEEEFDLKNAENDENTEEPEYPEDGT